MKIICVGRNYAEHAKELNNPVPDDPVIFMKPDSALLINNKPFFLPDFSKEIHYEAEIVLKVSRLGKHIQKKFAHRYYEEVTIGIDFTARDLQQQCKKEGKPWEIAKAFDGSAVLGTFIHLEQIKNRDSIEFGLKKNGVEVQHGYTGDMLFGFSRIIEYVSTFVTLKMGDLIYTGTPAGVGKIQINDHLEGYIEDKKLLDFYVK
ncbi:MAG: fumarylacetoacetate hydrolase family protein [Bacteroidales bacterium]|nr:fumarylacetoacetate hydrolase family protein [Bacteroidales bacterium]